MIVHAIQKTCSSSDKHSKRLLKEIGSVDFSVLLSLFSIEKTEAVSIPTSTSFRASQRRLRAENTTYRLDATSSSSDMQAPRFLILESFIVKAFEAMQENRFEDSLLNLDVAEKMLTPSLFFMSESIIYSIYAGSIYELKAYCQAMLSQNDAAHALHNQAVEKLAPLLAEFDQEIGSDFSEFFSKHLAIQKGLYFLLKGDQENGIEELKKLAATQEIPLILILAALEKQLNVKILTLKETTSSEPDPTELFLAGRYKEALQAIDKEKLGEMDSVYWPDLLNLKSSCYAMLGRYEEALDACKDFGSYDGAIQTRFIQLMKGNLEEAKNMTTIDSDEFFDSIAYLMPLNLTIKLSEGKL